ncbi:MAG: energy transducer TonB [Alistipes sp.]|nr:energy transducer TonB [Alistipes sp.]
MKELITYVAEVIVCAGVFTVFYSLLLERRVKFALCRGWLLASMLAAALIPALRIPVWDGGTVYMKPEAVIAETITAETADERPPFDFVTLFRVVYFAGAALMAAIAAAQLLRMRRMRKNAVEVEFGEFRLLKVNEKISSFSFFRTIFVSADTPAEDLPVIIAHESGHIRHRHSAERLMMELLKTALWWNPFVWTAARRLIEVQEYEADSEVLGKGYDLSNYINTLLKHLFGYSPDIANGLRDSLTKKRLKMMTQSKNGRYVLLRMAAAVPVVAGLMTAFSFTAKAARVATGTEPQPQKLSTTIVVTGDGEAAVMEGRGLNPLVIIDGEVAVQGDLNALDPAAIESITVLKEETAKRLYGDKGDVSDGVIVVATKSAAAAVTAGRMPEFVNNGSPEDFRSWVMTRIRFPQEALENGVCGRVTASFVVGRDGSVGDVGILASPDEMLSNEVARVLKSSPAWTPGTENGEAVDVRFTMAFDFAVSTPDGIIAPRAGEESEIIAVGTSDKSGASAPQVNMLNSVTVVGYGK